MFSTCNHWFQAPLPPVITNSVLDDHGVTGLVDIHLHLETLVQQLQKIILVVVPVVDQTLAAYLLVGMNEVHQIKVAEAFIWIQRVGVEEDLLHHQIGLIPLTLTRIQVVVMVEDSSRDSTFSGKLLVGR